LKRREKDPTNLFEKLFWAPPMGNCWWPNSCGGDRPGPRWFGCGRIGPWNFGLGCWGHFKNPKFFVHYSGQSWRWVGWGLSPNRQRWCPPFANRCRAIPGSLAKAQPESACAAKRASQTAPMGARTEALQEVPGTGLNAAASRCLVQEALPANAAKTTCCRPPKYALARFLGPRSPSGRARPLPHHRLNGQCC